MVKRGILVIAGDASIRALLARWLITAGFKVELAESLKHARGIVGRGQISLAIVEIDSHGLTRIEVTRELSDDVGRILFITEKAEMDLVVSETRDIDNLVKPLSQQQVQERLNSILRPTPVGNSQDKSELHCFDGYTIDAQGRTCVDAGGKEIGLTRAEFSLLLALVRQPGRVLSRDDLSQAVAGRSAEPDDRSIDVLISRLRRKIEADAKMPRTIVTMPGEGYKFTVQPQAVVAGRALGVPSTEVILPYGKSARSRVAVAAFTILFAAVAMGGWLFWSHRIIPTPSVSTSPSASVAVPPPSVSNDARRVAIFSRMVATMKQDDRFAWRTIERLAIEAGVTEPEAHEILAEHPEEIVLGKSRDDKLIARLSGR